ncbi:MULTISPECIES: hypothetical protein [unclassified Pedobacter]|uniref:hypothetical protein n=1 Tax=unclassified Pedobacter TaxID=2628915 RepID=UPI001D99443C|nr:MULTISPECIES: hypothetical protein [unclassified Pedobacter]CAH0162934.1 hypothetical protein SRABI126_00831 [Pedobacter sp. Bi126]CAH0281895.1 hypothetical protein SRABI36_04043 [Pedobacter sp. Bi36]
MIDSVLPRYILQEQMFIYACWSIVIFFFRKTEFISILDISIIWLIRIVGIVFFLQFPVIFCADWLSGDHVQYAFINRFTGPYWFPAVFPLFVYLFSTQSLWFIYFQKARYWRLIFGLLILASTFTNDIILWISGFQRDSFASSWRIAYQLSFLHIESFVVFAFITGFGYLMLREKNN